MSCRQSNTHTHILMACFDEVSMFTVKLYDTTTGDIEVIIDLPFSALGYTDAVPVKDCIVVVDQLSGKLLVYRDVCRIEGVGMSCKVGLTLIGKAVHVYEGKAYFQASGSNDVICQLRVFTHRYEIKRVQFLGISISHICIENGILYWAGICSRRACVGRVNLITMKSQKITKLPKRTPRPTSLACTMGWLVLTNAEVSFYDYKNKVTVFDKYLNEIANCQINVGNNRELQLIQQANTVFKTEMIPVANGKYMIVSLSIDGDKSLAVIEFDLAS